LQQNTIDVVSSIFRGKRSYAYRKAVSLFKRFFDELDDMNKKYMLHALEIALEKWDPSPLYHFLSFKERESVLQGIEYRLVDVPFKTYPGSSLIVLPRPSKNVDVFRDFLGRQDYEVNTREGHPPSIQDVSDLLYYSLSSPGAFTSGVLRRPFTSFLGQPVIETYLYTALDGELYRKLSHYLPHAHSLEVIKEDDLLKEFYLATLDGFFEESYVIFIFTVRYNEIFTNHYHRAYRIALLEAGSALSTFLRVVAALGLKARVSLDFIDRHICRHLELDCYSEFPYALVSIFRA